jgi:hypothetical protein
MYKINSILFELRELFKNRGATAVNKKFIRLLYRELNHSGELRVSGRFRSSRCVSFSAKVFILIVSQLKIYTNTEAWTVTVLVRE